MIKRRFFNSVVIAILLVVVLSLSVAFSAFYQALEVTGVVNMTSQASNWSITFDDIVSLNTTGYATGSSTGGNKKITFSCEFIAENDSCELTGNIENNGSINALYKSATLQVVKSGIVLQNNSNNYSDDIIEILLTTPVGWIENETLLRTNDIGAFKIKANLKDISSLDESTKYTITVSFNFEQGENK